MEYITPSKKEIMIASLKSNLLKVLQCKRQAIHSFKIPRKHTREGNNRPKKKEETKKNLNPSLLVTLQTFKYNRPTPKKRLKSSTVGTQNPESYNT